MKLRKVFSSITLAVGIGLIIYATVNIIRINIPLLRGMKAYSASISPAAAETNRDRWAEVNPDIVGWLTVEGTGIDFPVLQDKALREDFLENGRYTFERPEDDAEYLKLLFKYLYHDYKGDPSDVGSILIDAVYDIDGAYAVIYGHNAHSAGVLFSDLKNFEDETFFKQHQTAVFYTETKTENLELIMVSEVSAYSSAVYGWNGLREGTFDTDAMVQQLSENRIFGEAKEYDRYVLLSTCYESADDDARLVLLYGVGKIE